MRDLFPSMRSSRADDANYFRSRAFREQIAAQEATCEAARIRHEQLAALYRFRALMASNQFQFEPETRERIAEKVG